MVSGSEIASGIGIKTANALTVTDAGSVTLLTGASNKRFTLGSIVVTNSSDAAAVVSIGGGQNMSWMYNAKINPNASITFNPSHGVTMAINTDLTAKVTNAGSVGNRLVSFVVNYWEDYV